MKAKVCFQHTKAEIIHHQHTLPYYRKCGREKEGDARWKYKSMQRNEEQEMETTWVDTEDLLLKSL